MKNSKIEWTESTWNPVTGCTKVSPGCLNCYAERMAYRLKAMNSSNYQNGFELTCHAHILDEPKKWKKSKIVFVNSMSDLFHEKVELSFIKKIFGTMFSTPQHQYQILTKRAERLFDLKDQLVWPKNVWMGVSVENKNYVHRINLLRQTNAKIKFLSIEPLLGPIHDMDLTGIDWVIVGGESGPGARPIKEEWVTDIKKQCEYNGVPFFFKQWGGINKKAAGRLLNGKVWDQMPKFDILRPSYAVT